MDNDTAPPSSDHEPIRSGSVVEVNPKPKASRSRLGCITCRARKVKCDERPGLCLNCERLNLNCQSADGGAADASRRSSFTGIDSLLSNASKKRKRTYRSCAECRASKSRCSGDKPNCARCNQKSLACQYDLDASGPQWTRKLHSDSMSMPSGSTVSHDDDSGESDEELPILPRPSGFNDSEIRSSQTPSIAEGAGEASRTDPNYRVPSLLYTPRSNPEHLDSLSWLFTPALPSKFRIRILVKEYFENVHPLRCYAFIHKPTFMQRLDERSSENLDQNALLHIVCALGAKFYALQYAGSLPAQPGKSVLGAGNTWAKRAHQLLFNDLENISIDNLMAAVLIHDHDIRLGNYASAFMLTGLCARMAQALQVNLEYSSNVLGDEPDGPSMSSKESRRRLMWSCYIQDALIGSGVDQLTIFREEDIKIQLPCNERCFLLQIPCVTETLGVGDYLKFLPSGALPADVSQNMGIGAYFIRLVQIRRRVLRYVKHLDTTQDPWLPDSEFAILDAEIHEWYRQLPASLQLTRSTLYTRKESSQLGAFILLQTMYHWSICDLYRIAMPKMYRLRLRWTFPQEFQDTLRYAKFQHAKCCATILADAARHGIRTLADSWLPSVAFDSNRVMLFYMTQVVGLDTERGQALANETFPYIQSNLDVLKSMQAISAMADAFHQAGDSMVKKAGLGSLSVHNIVRPVASSETGSSDLITEGSRAATPTQSAPDYTMQPTSIYAMARNSIQERHAPEITITETTTSSTPTAVTAATGAGLPANPSPATPASFASYQTIPRVAYPPAPSQQPQPPLYPNTTSSTPTALADIHSFFTSRFDGTWQPAETANAALSEASGGGGGGLPPWMPSVGMGDMEGGELQFSDLWPVPGDMIY